MPKKTTGAVYPGLRPSPIRGGLDTDMSHPRIYNRFDVFRNNNDEIRVVSTSLGLGPVTVETFEEGKALCNQWHRNYWEQLLTDIKSNILENED